MRFKMDIPLFGLGKFSLYFLVLLLLVQACKDTASLKDKDLEGDIQEVELPEGFMTFLDKFGKDSVFQMSSIQWPLSVQKALIDPEDEPETITSGPENWKLQHTFDDMQGTYSQQFINFNGVVTEVTSDQSGQYTMLRRFSKIDGKWKLIFYKEMGL
jgi:hypothetical protein